MRSALLLAALAAAAPAIKVEAPQKAELGAALRVRAELEHPAGEAVELEVLRSTSAFALVGVAESRTATGRTFDIDLVPLDLGRQGVSLVWTYREAPGAAPQVVSTPLTLEVQEPPSVKEKAEPRDIKPPWRARPRYWLLALAALALAAAALLWRMLRRPKLAAEAPGQGRLSALSAEQRAGGALDELEASGLWQAGRRAEFYLRLTEVLRAYLEERFGFPATRSTTAEALRRLRALDVDRAALGTLRGVFERADLVKFARLEAEEGWAGLDLGGARGFVAACAPKAEAPR